MLTIHVTCHSNCFICPLCRGYLVNAVAINESHHRFCKSCIYSYFFKDVFNRQKEQAEQHHLRNPPNSGNPQNNKNIFKNKLQYRPERANSSSSLNSTTSTVKSSISTFSPPPSFASSTTSSINQQVSSKLADYRRNNEIHDLNSSPAPTSELETKTDVYSRMKTENSILSTIGLRGEEAVSFLEIKRFEIFVIFLRKPDI